MFRETSTILPRRLLDSPVKRATFGIKLAAALTRVSLGYGWPSGRALVTHACMNAYTLASLAAYFVLMIAIELYAWRKSTGDSEGYLLAGRNLPPAVAALSAGASDMSGWLLLGLPGALYAAGLVEAWIGIGLFCGALANWILVAPRLREQTERIGNALTIPQFLANRFPERRIALRVTSAVIIVAFFTVYTAAGLVGGGKLFETAFAGILPNTMFSDYMMGILITAGIVLAYTMVGGFLAVSLTDFVQGLIMMVALVVMPLVVMFGPGGSAECPPHVEADQRRNGIGGHAVAQEDGEEAGAVDLQDSKAGLADLLDTTIIRGGTESRSPVELAVLLDDNAIKMGVDIGLEETAVKLSVMSQISLASLGT